MADKEIRRAASRFRKEYRIRDLSPDTLTNALEKQGYTVVEFRPMNNEPEVALLLKNLHLEDRAIYTRGFVYADSHYRMVFVSEDLSDSEKTLVLAHEQGHIYLKHLSHASVIGVDVQEEYEANEFVHYLMNPRLSQRAGETVLKYKIPIAIGLVLLAVGLFGGTRYREYKDAKTYFMEYYVTPHGTKYHIKECSVIEGKDVRRLTKEDIESGEYEPSNFCIP